MTTTATMPSQSAASRKRKRKPGLIVQSADLIGNMLAESESARKISPAQALQIMDGWGDYEKTAWSMGGRGAHVKWAIQHARYIRYNSANETMRIAWGKDWVEIGAQQEASMAGDGGQQSQNFAGNDFH